MVAWLGVVLALSLGSIGIYVGRFIRLNSWDALLDPIRVAQVVNDQLAAVPTRAAETLVALVAFLLVAYLVYSFAGLDVERDE